MKENYYDLDLDEPKKKIKNNREHKYRISKLQVFGIMFIVFALTYKIIGFNRSPQLVDQDNVEVVDYVDVELRDTTFHYSTDDFRSDTLTGRLSNENEIAQAKYNTVDIENGDTGWNLYVKSLNTKLINDSTVTVIYNDYINMDNDKMIYQLKYYNEEYAVYDTYWIGKNTDTAYLFSITVKYSNNPEESLSVYDNAVDTIINSIEMR